VTVTTPAWLVVGGVIVVGGALGYAGSKIGGWIGGAIGRIWDSPVATAAVIDIPTEPEHIEVRRTTVGYETMPAAAPAAPATTPAAPSSLRMREDQRPAHRPIEPALSITKGL